MTVGGARGGEGAQTVFLVIGELINATRKSLAAATRRPSDRTHASSR